MTVPTADDLITSIEDNYGDLEWMVYGVYSGHKQITVSAEGIEQVPDGDIWGHPMIGGSSVFLEGMADFIREPGSCKGYWTPPWSVPALFAPVAPNVIHVNITW